MKYSKIAIIGALAVVPVGYLIAQSDERKPPTDLKQISVPVDQAEPLKVDGTSRVAVLTLTGKVEDGRTTGLEVADKKVVATYSPKVRERSAGDWQINVGGDKGFSYMIPNPLTDIEIENREGNEAPFRNLQASEAGDVTIVIPLTDGDNVFSADDIEIIELNSKETLLSPSKREKQ